MRLCLPVLGPVVLLMSACGEPTPANPASPSLPPFAPPPTLTFTVSGVVRTAGEAVEGARVVVVGEAIPAATTDHNGFYSVSGVPPSFDRLSPMLSAFKAGYFTDVAFANPAYAPINRNTTLDFNLVPATAIAVDEVVHGRVEGAGMRCSHWGYGSSPCQRYAVTAPRTGTLEVAVTGPITDFDVDIVGPDGQFVLYHNVLGPRQIPISVQAGSTYEIRVVGYFNEVREFELVTTMR